MYSAEYVGDLEDIVLLWVMGQWLVLTRAPFVESFSFENNSELGIPLSIRFYLRAAPLLAERFLSSHLTTECHCRSKVTMGIRHTPFLIIGILILLLSAHQYVLNQTLWIIAYVSDRQGSRWRL